MLLKKYKKYRNVQLSKNVEKQIIDNFSVNSITTPGFVNYKKGALDSQPQEIKFTSCLSMVGGSLQVLRLPPPLKLVAMI